MYENEWFPKVNGILGVTWEEFWKLNPHIINLLLKGHEEKIKEQDYLAWLSNQYTLSAVSVAVEHCFAGRKAKSKYIEKPLLETAITENEKTDEEELRIQRELFVSRLEAIGANFRLSQQNKGGTGS